MRTGTERNLAGETHPHRGSVAVWLQRGRLCSAEVPAAHQLRSDELGPVLFGEHEWLRLCEPAAENLREAHGILKVWEVRSAWQSLYARVRDQRVGVDAVPDGD